MYKTPANKVKEQENHYLLISHTHTISVIILAN
jgi:hypothetical protein